MKPTAENQTDQIGDVSTLADPQVKSAKCVSREVLSWGRGLR
jgi:hypothetical protein